MTDEHGTRDYLEPGAEPELLAVAERLTAARPVPRAAFRGDLGRDLTGRQGREFATIHVRWLVATYSLAGVALLCAGTVSAAGIGPLG